MHRPTTGGAGGSSRFSREPTWYSLLFDGEVASSSRRAVNARATRLSLPAAEEDEEEEAGEAGGDGSGDAAGSGDRQGLTPLDTAQL
jgi:hypothetical protein